MPSHNLHDAATVVATGIAAFPALWLTLQYNLPWFVPIAFLLGGLSGLVLSPDLDVNTGSFSFTRMRKWTGPIIGAVWEKYWYGYGQLFGHRGLSHTPLLGTATRVAYGCVWLLPLLAMPWAFSLAWLAGLAWSDFWHFILDELDKLSGGRL